jgi:hypothetical protein
LEIKKESVDLKIDLWYHAASLLNGKRRNTMPNPETTLTPGQLKAWNKVHLYKEKNPDTSNHAAIKATGVTGSMFHAAARRMGVGKKKRPYRRHQMISLAVPEVVSGKVVALVGSPEAVVHALKGFI